MMKYFVTAIAAIAIFIILIASGVTQLAAECSEGEQDTSAPHLE